MSRWVWIVIAAAVAVPGATRADSSSTKAAAVAELDCRAVLDALAVDYERARRKGVSDGVAVRGEISGVRFVSLGAGPQLVVDCSLAVSLALAAPYFAAQGISRIGFSSAFDRRYVRGTSRLSRHSYGLAIDVTTLTGDSVGTLTLRDHFEQGLGDNVDCVGRPLTAGGMILRRLTCQLTRSELFRIVLDPDFDAYHYHHFHLEALPWGERVDRDLIGQRLRRAASRKAK